LAENVEPAGTRCAYDTGNLEIMVVSVGHERPNRTLAALVEVVAEETGRDFCPTGSATFKRKDLEKGFEPDSSFYLEQAAAVRDKDEIDLMTDPPPDLVIEVDITRSSLDRFLIFAALRVPEVWRYDSQRVSMHRLESGAYQEIPKSVALPPLTASQATLFLDESRRRKRSDWLRGVRAWVGARR
jgi:Uma2 family endonuclease